MREQALADLLEERLFEGDGFVLRAEGFFLEFFQLVGDVAFAVGGRLLSRPTGGGFVAMKMSHFNVVAEDFVEADAKGGNATLGGKASLILGEPLVGVRADVAQAVEFRVELVGDHAPLAKVRRRIGFYCANEKFRLIGDEAAKVFDLGRNVFGAG